MKPLRKKAIAPTVIGTHGKSLVRSDVSTFYEKKKPKKGGAATTYYHFLDNLAQTRHVESSRPPPHNTTNEFVIDDYQHCPNALTWQMEDYETH